MAALLATSTASNANFGGSCLSVAVAGPDGGDDFGQEFVDLLGAAAGEGGGIDGGVEVDFGERAIAFEPGDAGRSRRPVA